MQMSAFRTARTIAACFAGVLLLSAGAGGAGDPPTPSEVLTDLHKSNSREIAMGKLAQKNGHSKEIKDFGRTLVKDHTAADKKVMAFAKKEKIDLPTTTDMKSDDMDMGTGADFDAKFAEHMLDDHKKDVATVMSARDSTTDDKLKGLLNQLLPTLEKHRDTAQKLVDAKK